MYIVSMPMIAAGILIFLLCHEIYTDRKYKEIEARGKSIKGKIVEIKYIRHKRFPYTRTGKCNLMVSCKIQSEQKEQKILKALSAVDDHAYSVDDEINLLHLEEYPKIIIVEGIPSMTKNRMIGYIIIIAVFIVLTAFMAYNNYENYSRNQERGRWAEEWIEEFRNSQE